MMSHHSTSTPNGTSPPVKIPEDVSIITKLVWDFCDPGPGLVPSQVEAALRLPVSKTDSSTTGVALVPFPSDRHNLLLQPGHLQQGAPLDVETHEVEFEHPLQQQVLEAADFGFLCRVHVKCLVEVQPDEITGTTGGEDPDHGTSGEGRSAKRHKANNFGTSSGSSSTKAKHNNKPASTSFRFTLPEIAQLLRAEVIEGDGGTSTLAEPTSTTKRRFGVHFNESSTSSSSSRVSSSNTPNFHASSRTSTGERYNVGTDRRYNVTVYNKSPSSSRSANTSMSTPTTAASNIRPILRHATEVEVVLHVGYWDRGAVMQVHPGDSNIDCAPFGQVLSSGCHAFVVSPFHLPLLNSHTVQPPLQVQVRTPLCYTVLGAGQREQSTVVRNVLHYWREEAEANDATAATPGTLKGVGENTSEAKEEEKTGEIDLTEYSNLDSFVLRRDPAANFYLLVSNDIHVEDMVITGKAGNIKGSYAAQPSLVEDAGAVVPDAPITPDTSDIKRPPSGEKSTEQVLRINSSGSDSEDGDFLTIRCVFPRCLVQFWAGTGTPGMLRDVSYIFDYLSELRQGRDWNCFPNRELHLVFLPLPMLPGEVYLSDSAELPPVHGENFIFLDLGFVGTPLHAETALRAYCLQAVIAYTYLRLFHPHERSWIVTGLTSYIADIIEQRHMGDLKMEERILNRADMVAKNDLTSDEPSKTVLAKASISITANPHPPTKRKAALAFHEMFRTYPEVTLADLLSLLESRRSLTSDELLEALTRMTQGCESAVQCSPLDFMQMWVYGVSLPRVDVLWHKDNKDPATGRVRIIVRQSPGYKMIQNAEPGPSSGSAPALPNLEHLLSHKNREKPWLHFVGTLTFEICDARGVPIKVVAARFTNGSQQSDTIEAVVEWELGVDPEPAYLIPQRLWTLCTLKIYNLPLEGWARAMSAPNLRMQMLCVRRFTELQDYRLLAEIVTRKWNVDNSRNTAAAIASSPPNGNAAAGLTAPEVTTGAAATPTGLSTPGSAGAAVAIPINANSSSSTGTTTAFVPYYYSAVRFAAVRALCGDKRMMLTLLTLTREYLFRQHRGPTGVDISSFLMTQYLLNETMKLCWKNIKDIKMDFEQTEELHAKVRNESNINLQAGPGGERARADSTTSTSTFGSSNLSSTSALAKMKNNSLSVMFLRTTLDILKGADNGDMNAELLRAALPGLEKLPYFCPSFDFREWVTRRIFHR
ncbi:unnamed protein product, partial [Amoebophrya sp. A25]|eukprot:GSA25T00027316001.1